MRRIVSCLLCLGAVVSQLVISGPSAEASCVPPAPTLQAAIDAADVVFSGTVTSISADGRDAHVVVQQVWKGPALPELVEISGGPTGGASATSVDRHYIDGRSYLFFPTNSGPPFLDNSCSSTRLYTSEIARVAPPTPTPTGTRPGDGISSPIGLVMLLVLLGALVLQGRRIIGSHSETPPGK